MAVRVTLLQLSGKEQLALLAEVPRVDEWVLFNGRAHRVCKVAHATNVVGEMLVATRVGVYLAEHREMTETEAAL